VASGFEAALIGCAAAKQAQPITTSSQRVTLVSIITSNTPFRAFDS
jgi:hypothetical protein